MGEGSSSRGYLAKTADEYAEAMHSIFSLPMAERDALQVKARQSVADRFSDEAFARDWLACTEPLLRSASTKIE